MNKIKLKLKSDFRDFYDHAFSLDGEEFCRMTSMGPTRQEMFQVFSQRNINTPIHGQVEDLEAEYLVVYIDNMSHCGEVISCEPVGDMLFKSFSFPLYAVDYIEDRFGLLYAVDLNIAPGMRNSGIEKYLKPKEVVGELKQWFDIKRRKNAR